MTCEDATTGICLKKYEIFPSHDKRYNPWGKVCKPNLVTAHYMKAPRMRSCWPKIKDNALRSV